MRHEIRLQTRHCCRMHFDCYYALKSFRKLNAPCANMRAAFDRAAPCRHVFHGAVKTAGMVKLSSGEPLGKVLRDVLARRIPQPKVLKIARTRYPLSAQPSHQSPPRNVSTTSATL